MNKFDQNSENYGDERNYREHNTMSNYSEKIENGAYSHIANNVTFYPSINQLYFFIEKG